MTRLSGIFSIIIFPPIKSILRWGPPNCLGPLVLDLTLPKRYATNDECISCNIKFYNVLLYIGSVQRE